MLAFEVIESSSASSAQKGESTAGTCMNIEECNTNGDLQSNRHPTSVDIKVYYNHKPLKFCINGRDYVTSLSLEQLKGISLGSQDKS